MCRGAMRMPGLGMLVPAAAGDWGLTADPDPRGRARVLPAQPVPEEPPRHPAVLGCSVCPSVLLERPHCSHTSVPTPGPEPRGQGLPLICGTPEHPCRGRTLPEAERGFHLPASCCNHQIIWGWREARAHMCVHLAWAVSPQARGDMPLGWGQMARWGQGLLRARSIKRPSCSHSPSEPEQAPGRPSDSQLL